MKKNLFFVVLLIAVVAMAFTACAPKTDSAALEAELAALKEQLSIMSQQPAETETETVEVEVPANYAAGVNCTLNGEAFAPLDGETQLNAEAVIPEGMAFDHWEVNGVVDEAQTEETAVFTASESTLVNCVLHEEHKVTTINAYLQFLNEKGNADGEKYTEFVFEEEYENPVTKEMCEEDLITCYVTADVPKGYAVDYWKINEVPYYFNRTVTAFGVENLDEATVYEVVLKEVKESDNKKKDDGGKETGTYYTVTCHNCTFKGDGASGTSGKVPAGSKVTVRAKCNSSLGYFTATPSSAGKGSYSNPINGKPAGDENGWAIFSYSYSFTIDSDTDIKFDFIVN